MKPPSVFPWTRRWIRDDMPPVSQSANVRGASLLLLLSCEHRHGGLKLTDMASRLSRYMLSSVENISK